MKFGKAWGETKPIVSTPLFSLHEIRASPHWRCSRHDHAQKWNLFYCISGRVFIDIEKKDYPLTDTTELGPGEATTVRPGEVHHFYTKDEPAVVLEAYYLEPLSD